MYVDFSAEKGKLDSIVSPSVNVIPSDTEHWRFTITTYLRIELNFSSSHYAISLEERFVILCFLTSFI